MENEHIEQSSYFKYILITICCIIIFIVLKKYRTGEQIQDRIWRKIAFAYQDLLHTFDQAEKELLKHTYHNTIFNSKGVIVSGDGKKPNKKKSSNVQFDLNKNETLCY